MPGYGVTEATVHQTICEVRGLPGDAGLAGVCREGGGGSLMHVVGRAMEGVEVEVDGDEERGGGVVGEVLIGGVQVVKKE